MFGPSIAGWGLQLKFGFVKIIIAESDQKEWNTNLDFDAHR